MTAIELRQDNDNPANEWDVFSGDQHLGVVTDEGEHDVQRGRFAAWSAKCRNPHSVVGFFDTREDAVDAIAALFQEPQPRRIFASADDAQRVYVGPVAGRPYSPLATHSSGIPMAYQPHTHDRFVVVRREDTVYGKTTHVVWDRHNRAYVFSHHSETAALNNAAKRNAG